jgi:hypothetical protein
MPACNDGVDRSYQLASLGQAQQSGIIANAEHYSMLRVLRPGTAVEEAPYQIELAEAGVGRVQIELRRVGRIRAGATPARRDPIPR